jgi:hypothetical protein
VDGRMDVDLYGLTFEIEVTSPSRDAYISGRPEDCYEADPCEWECLSVTADGDTLLPDKVRDWLVDNWSDKIDEIVQEKEREDRYA